MKALAILLVPALAHADPELGTPLPGRTAMPALTGLDPGVMGMAIDYVPKLPSIDLGGGVRAPQRSATFLDFDFTSFISGFGPGWYRYYGVGGGMGLHVGGSVGDSFMANGTTYTDGSATEFAITPLAPGVGYRTTGWVAGVQLVPRIEWFAEEYKHDGMRVAGIDHDYVLRADLQVCMAFNIAGMMSKNSAACVYAQPVIYREGWLSGTSVGLRLIMI